MNETHAIQLCIRHRDPVGFEYLVKKYRKNSYHTAFAILQNREDALDACQDAFEKAFRALLKKEALDRFYPWFYVILKNTCLNMISRQQTRFKYDPVLNQCANRNLPPSADHLLQKGEQGLRVMEALHRLKPDFRQVIILKYFEGKTYNQMAALLNISRGTVTSRLYYAKKEMANALEKIK